MAYTTHWNLPLMPTGAVNWPALFNDFAAKAEAGRTVLVTGGEALSKYHVVYTYSDGKVWKSGSNTHNIIGIVQSSFIGLNGTGYVQTDGYMTYGSWAWTPGTYLYSNSSGGLTATPSNSGVRVAYAFSATTILILAPIHSSSYETHANTGLKIWDTNTSHPLTIQLTSDLTAARTLSIATGDAARTLTIGGDVTLNDWFDQSVKTTGTPRFERLGLGAAADGVAPLSLMATSSPTASTDQAKLFVKDINAETGKAGLHLQNEVGPALIVCGVQIKADTGDPAVVWEGLLVVNSYDNNIKLYGDGAFRQLATW